MPVRALRGEGRVVAGATFERERLASPQLRGRAGEPAAPREAPAPRDRRRLERDLDLPEDCFIRRAASPRDEERRATSPRDETRRAASPRNGERRATSPRDEERRATPPRDPSPKKSSPKKSSPKKSPRRAPSPSPSPRRDGEATLESGDDGAEAWSGSSEDPDRAAALARPRLDERAARASRRRRRAEGGRERDREERREERREARRRQKREDARRRRHDDAYRDDKERRRRRRDARAPLQGATATTAAAATTTARATRPGPARRRSPRPRRPSAGASARRRPRAPRTSAGDDGRAPRAPREPPPPRRRGPARRAASRRPAARRRGPWTSSAPRTTPALLARGRATTRADGPRRSTPATCAVDGGRLVLRSGAAKWRAAVPLASIAEVDWDARHGPRPASRSPRRAARAAYYFKIPTPDHHDVVADIVATIEERQPESGGGDQSNPLQVTPDFRLPAGVRARPAPTDRAPRLPGVAHPPRGLAGAWGVF
ncbi:hypothetical protein SO694_00013029 [Aureococcus anophagefferens]|uniref:Uncharacterized protein n=1 Tax=Aureococcus anophagefferens TaxID=44056 RepID=A0ABR1G1V0_AURAN